MRRSNSARSPSPIAPISASAKRPMMRSISRMPRCQARNKVRLRRSSRSALVRVEPLMHASCPGRPGRRYIASDLPMPDSRETAPLRPAILNPLFAPAASLPGVGPKMAVLLDRLLGEPERPARVLDLLFHLPHGGIARDLKGSLPEAPIGETLTLKVRVSEHRPGLQRGKAPYRVLVEDDSGDVLLVFRS